MSQFNDIINSLKEKIEVFQALQQQFGTSSNFQKNNDMCRDISQINYILDNMTNSLQAERQSTLNYIFHLKEDISRINLVQGKFNLEELGWGQNNFTLVEIERSLLSKRNSMLKSYFQNLINFLQSTESNYSTLRTNLNNIFLNDFTEMNQFIIDNFMELQIFDLSMIQKAKPTITLDTILDSYSDLSIHTPLNQITLPSICVSSPARKIYRSPQNLVIEQNKKNNNKNNNNDDDCVIPQIKINTRIGNNVMDTAQLLYGENSGSPKTPLQKLLSPINIINRRISNTEQNNETLESPIIKITSTKYTSKNNKKKRALSRKFSNGPMKSC